MGDINKAASLAEQIANDNTHGYSQSSRNGPDYDCSSLIGTVLNQAGFNVSPYSWTGNLYSQLINCGFKLVNDAPKRGDIYMSHNDRFQHVVICISPWQIVQASQDEKGGYRDGVPGDQTGREISVCNFYNPYGGWDYHFRYEEPIVNPEPIPLGLPVEETKPETQISATPTTQNTKTISVKAIELKKGSTGDAVCVLQCLLLRQYYDLGSYGIDGEFGNCTEQAVRDYQEDTGLVVDGIVGQSTWSMLLQRWLC